MNVFPRVIINDSSTGLRSVINSVMQWAFPKPTMASIVGEICHWMFPPLVIHDSSAGFRCVIDFMLQWTYATLKLASFVDEIYRWLMILGVLYWLFNSYGSRPQWIKDLPRRPTLMNWAGSSLPVYVLVWILARIHYGGITVDTDSSLWVGPWEALIAFLLLLIVLKNPIHHKIDYFLWGPTETLFP
jgi:hypothetical protein